MKTLLSFVFCLISLSVLGQAPVLRHAFTTNSPAITTNIVRNIGTNSVIHAAKLAAGGTLPALNGANLTNLNVSSGSVTNLSTNYVHEFWGAVRLDGLPGVGTQWDPWDMSTAAKFDQHSYRSDFTNGGVLNLQSGTYSTFGFDSLAANAQTNCLLANMVIRGAGMGQTIIRPVGMTNATRSGAVIGSAYDADWCGVENLTVDCATNGVIATNVTIHGIALHGSQIRVSQVEVKHMGSRNVSEADYWGIYIDTLLNGPATNATVVDCYVHSPVTNAVNAGNGINIIGWATNFPGRPNNQLYGGTVRNCWVDGAGSGADFHGIFAPTILHSTIRNCTEGSYNDTVTTDSVYYFKVHFENCVRGIYWPMETGGAAGLTNQQLFRLTTILDCDFEMSSGVLSQTWPIDIRGTYGSTNGGHLIIDNNQFRYVNDAASTNSEFLIRVWNCERLDIRNNTPTVATMTTAYPFQVYSNVTHVYSWGNLDRNGLRVATSNVLTGELYDYAPITAQDGIGRLQDGGTNTHFSRSGSPPVSVANFENSELYYNEGTVPSLQFGEGYGNDNNNVTSYDWALRNLYDTNGLVTFNWNGIPTFASIQAETLEVTGAGDGTINLLSAGVTQTIVSAASVISPSYYGNVGSATNSAGIAIDDLAVGGTGINTNGGSGSANTFSNATHKGITTFGPPIYSNTWVTLESVRSEDSIKVPFTIGQSWASNTLGDPMPDVVTSLSWNVANGVHLNKRQGYAQFNNESAWQNMADATQWEYWWSLATPTNGFGTNSWSGRWFAANLVWDTETKAFEDLNVNFLANRWSIENAVNNGGEKPFFVDTAGDGANQTIRGGLFVRTNSVQQGSISVYGGGVNAYNATGSGILGIFTEADGDANLQAYTASIGRTLAVVDFAALTVPDLAYNATTWNGSLAVPTRNAIRDKIESLTSVTGTLTNQFTTNVVGQAVIGDVLFGGNVSITNKTLAVALPFAVTDGLVINHFDSSGGISIGLEGPGNGPYFGALGNRIGIDPLRVLGTFTRFQVETNLYVVGGTGLGITEPLTRLHVVGAMYANAVNSDTVFTGNPSANTTMNLIGSDGYWALRTGTAGDVNLDVYNFSTTTTALKVDATGLIVNPQANIRTNIGQFDVSITDFVIGTRYTNSARRSFVTASFQLSAAAAGTASVSLRVEQVGVTNRVNISAGPLASLTTTEQLSLLVGPGAFYYFTDDTSGAGASVSIVAGTSSRTDW